MSFIRTIRFERTAFRYTVVFTLLAVMFFALAVCQAEEKKPKRARTARHKPAVKKVEPEKHDVLTPAEAAAAAAGVEMPAAPEVEHTPYSGGQVPRFTTPDQRPYSAESENQYYYGRADREGDSLAPGAPAKLRFYAQYLVGKYDKNGNGKLEESEWSVLPGAQGIDTDGDLVLTQDELLFYLVRYAQNRTIFKPEVQLPKSQRHQVSQAPEISLRPLSAKVKPVTKSKDKRTKTEKELADYNKEQVDKMLAAARTSVTKDAHADDEEAAEEMLESVRETAVREYAASATELRGMPRWFILRDKNGDGQLSLREFAPGLDLPSVAFFGKLDKNADGLVTPDELRAYIVPAPKK